MGLLAELSEDELKEWFPRFDRPYFIANITSEPTEAYNCFAWAARDQSKKWDWTDSSGRYWPRNIQPAGEIDDFVELYGKHGGYTLCANGDFESGFEKIALYVGLDKEVKHAARQLPSGLWTSKLGDFEDIQHPLAFLEGGGYGWATVFLKRPIES